MEITEKEARELDDIIKLAIDSDRYTNQYRVAKNLFNDDMDKSEHLFTLLERLCDAEYKVTQGESNGYYLEVNGASVEFLKNGGFTARYQAATLAEGDAKAQKILERQALQAQIELAVEQIIDSRNIKRDRNINIVATIVSVIAALIATLSPIRC